MKILPLKSIGAKENNICVEFRITFAVINHFYPNSFITSTKRHIERKQPHARKQVRSSTLGNVLGFARVKESLGSHICW